MRHAQIALASLVALAGCSSSDVGERVGAQASDLVLASLPGSHFEIDPDANLKVDGAAPALDWANVSEIRQADTPSGANDTSFVQGTKEDTAAPTIEVGGIPPNKSDLKFFGVYQEGGAGGGFLNLFWSRIQAPSGTTNMDFEFNQRQCTSGQNPPDPDCSANGVTPIRAIGDLLITYDLANGGTVPLLSLRLWTGSAWGSATDLSASTKAAGSVNTSTIPAAASDGLGQQDPFTFGEAQIALSAIFDPNKCSSFGSAYLKSRSSTAFTAALKDFVPPVPVSITNCGRAVVSKTDGTGPLGGAEFTISPQSSAAPPVSTFTHVATGLFCLDHLLLGKQYTITESTVPAGYDGASPQTFTPSTVSDCNNVTGSTTPDLTFVNVPQKGAILLTKLRKHVAEGTGNHPHAGVSFTVNGVTKVTDANGQACFDSLPLGTYAVHEAVPAGYLGEGDKNVIVDNKASCSDATYVGETVSFLNTPLSDLLISATPEVPGATQSTITCTGLNPSASNGTSASFTGLPPGTYNCVIFIDP